MKISRHAVMYDHYLYNEEDSIYEIKKINIDIILQMETMNLYFCIFYMYNIGVTNSRTR